MKRTLPLSAMAWLVAMSWLTARAEDPTDPATDGFEVLHVAGAVYALRTDTRTTNTNVCACVGEDGVLLVDASSYFTGSGVLCAGDYYFVGRYPIVDLEAGGSLEGYLANARFLLDSFPDDAFIVPGHGLFPPDAPRRHTMAEYAEWIATVEETVEHVRSRKGAGLSLEQVLEEGLPEAFAPLADRPRFVPEARWIEMVYGQIP